MTGRRAVGRGQASPMAGVERRMLDRIGDEVARERRLYATHQEAISHRMCMAVVRNFLCSSVCSGTAAVSGSKRVTFAISKRCSPTRRALKKRIGAELIEGSPALFLDNLNNTEFESNLLASAITERPARVRLLSSHRLKLRNQTQEEENQMRKTNLFVAATCRSDRCLQARPELRLLLPQLSTSTRVKRW
jgi:hypothetical protein